MGELGTTNRKDENCSVSQGGKHSTQVNVDTEKDKSVQARQSFDKIIQHNTASCHSAKITDEPPPSLKAHHQRSEQLMSSGPSDQPSKASTKTSLPTNTSAPPQVGSSSAFGVRKTAIKRPFHEENVSGYRSQVKPEKSRRVCSFYGTAAKCRKGRNCPNIHDLSQIQCRYWRAGYCHFGDHCIRKHSD